MIDRDCFELLYKEITLLEQIENIDFHEKSATW